jgi:NAD(P)-dependent dehydrogenase (short-subunit alcohol dehydrogenase family)
MTFNAAQGHGRIALVTGGTDGLGRAAAVMLAERGYRVFAGGRNAERIAALEQFASERKLPLEAIELDVCDEASVERGIAHIESAAGPVAVLVNNAGIAIVAVMEEITLADLHKQFETNYFGLLRVTQRVLPGMRAALWGRIVNMSSIAGKMTMPLFGAYSSSKHALEAVSDALRLELYPFGIYVALIEPGYIPTNMNRNAAELSSSYSKNAERSPYGPIYRKFFGAWDKTTKAARDTPEDCARVILRAIEETPPRARYPVTRRAKIGVIMRRLLPDRAMDSQFRKMFGLNEFRAALAKSSHK